MGVAGCASDAPTNDIGIADSELITVFFPAVDGLVRGRGLPGTFATSVTHVSIRAHPTGTHSIARVDANGGFTFTIIALGGDLLEISGSKDEDGRNLGAPLYIRVPPPVVNQGEYECCMPEGTCRLKQDEDVESPCPSRQQGTATDCTTDFDCGIDEGEYLTIDLDRIQVSPPNERGRASVTGLVTPNALVVVENRGLNGIGIPGPIYRSAQISTDRGAFEFPSIIAQGDDEIVIQVRDLNDYRSPAAATLVPDAALVGIDVLGVFAWEPLTNGQRGPVAVHVAPWGIDQKGICPDSDADLEICFSGGLDHSMLTFSRAEIAVGGTMVDLAPSPTATTAARRFDRGREGDVRSGPQDIVIVMDTSATAAMVDPSGLRFDAVADFISGLRRRDRVGLIAYSDVVDRALVVDLGRDSGLRDFEDRQEVIDAVRAYQALPPGDGNEVFTAMQAAAQNLRTARSSSGRIVLLTAESPQGLIDDVRPVYQITLEALSADLSRGYPTLSLDVVKLGPDDGDKNFELITDISTFTSGRAAFTNIDGIGQTLTSVRSFLSGNFILLYDMAIPPQIGKSGRVSLDIEFLMGNQRATASYSGPLRILNSSNN